MKMLQLRLFGAPSLAGPDAVVVGGRAAQRHRLALLALLALKPAQRATRDALVACLWPESTAARARNLLNVSVYTLRSVLGEDVLLSEGDDLRLDTRRIRCDVVEFEAALVAGQHAHAVSLYTGPFLDGFHLSDAPEFAEWAEGERIRLARLYAQALESLAEQAAASQDLAGAADRWKERAAADPFDSRVSLRLVQALAAAGNPAGALQHAATHERLLREELGVAPSIEFVEVVDSLRAEARRRTSLVPGPAAAKEKDSAIGAPPAGTEPSDSRRTYGGRTPYWRVGVGALVLVAAIAVIVAAVSRKTDPDRSIVVLPFVNLSADADNDYFADGLTEEVIGRLATVPGLKVTSRTSSMHYRGTSKPLREIANALGVAHVVEGSVRLVDGRFRVTVQLIEARRDRHIWAHSYDHDGAGLLRVQDEIAWAVAGALQIELVGGPEAVRRGTSDPEAYDLYRRGRYLWHTRTPEGQARAMEYYQRAIELDPGYADAYSGLADAYATRFQHNLTDLSAEELYSRAKWAAERAVALDDRSSDAHTSLAAVLWWQQNWPGALREMRRALELNPGNVQARYWHGLLLAGENRLDAALREMRHAYEIDPFNVVAVHNYAWACFHLRDYACVIEHDRRALEVEPSWAQGWVTLGLAQLYSGMTDAALASLRRAVELAPQRNDFLATLGYIHAASGRRDSAQIILHRVKHEPFEPFAVARVLIALGETDSAFVWLERANWRWPHRAIRADPVLDPLRSDPRFEELSRRIERDVGLR